MEKLKFNKTEDMEVKPSLSGSVLFPSENRMSHIKNKQVRIKKYQKVKHEKKKVWLVMFNYAVFSINVDLEKM